MPIRLPTANEVILAVTVLFALTCLGVTASLKYGDRTIFCDFVDKRALWEEEGIKCSDWSPYEPTTRYVCRETTGIEFMTWENVTVQYGPQYCSEEAVVEEPPAEAESPPLVDAALSIPTSTPNPDGAPYILNDQCVSKTQLMIVFEFDNAVIGQYELFVNDAPYEIAPVGGRPERLFFFGAAPAGGGKPNIRLQSLPDHNLIMEVTDYSVKQCDFQSPNNNNPGGDGDYVPPPPGPGD